MSRQVYLSGKLVPEAEARISIFDSAVTLGYTITESTRTFHHVPFKLDRHMQRLSDSLKVARIETGFSPQQMEEITLEVLDANRSQYGDQDDCWIVHNISAGESALGPNPAQQSRATIMIYTAPLDLSGWARFYRQGCHAVTASSRIIPAQSLDARIKNRSRLAYTLAEMEVKLVDQDAQGVILDIHGHVAENKGGNIFVVRDQVIRTPSVQNCLAGISRETILQLAQELGLECEETVLLPYDLYTADELFFTSTPYCIMPATTFNGVSVGSGKVGPVTRQLLQGWSEMVGLDIVAQAERQLDHSD